MNKTVWLGICLFLTAVSVQDTPLGRDTAPAENQLDAAAAYALHGMLKESRAILEAFPKDRRVLMKDDYARDSKGAIASREADQWNLVHALVDPEPPDQFDFLTTILVNREFRTDEADPIGSLLWQKVFVRLAERQEYPEIAAYMLERIQNSLKYRLQGAKDDSTEDLLALSLQMDEVSRELAHVKGRPPSMAGGTVVDEIQERDGMGAVIQRLLDAPRLVPFQEGTLAPRYAPITVSEEEAEAQVKKTSEAFPFPEDFSVVRAERQGDEVVAIGTSQDYDPVGELSRGAYWIVRSHDGGRTWGKPLYTGLRIQFPYVVAMLSNAPLLTSDRLQIEVKVQELDQASITFPPIGLRAKREQSGLLLEIPFADLQRDSDSDGLTDLAEERLITDPLHQDTDGDGVPDGVDPMPQVPWAVQLNESSRALAAALGWLSRGKSMAIIHEIDSAKKGVGDLLRRAKSATLTEERTLFIVGRREEFGPLLPTQRMIVLSPSEHEQAEKKFGPIFATHIELFVFDHTQTHALFIWDASWVGGTLRLDSVGGDWRVTPVSDWIT